ncbi:PhzF family phenazine biosynthesis protein [Sphingomonas sp. AR_OL41]|uniref:PhzF family phenazine biosynthesis protein n=1 Tax=Sphingomonas sp. AR_OL41 TaxID=3042729 RepID=UPI00248025EE|nr:PhzF family phenazine biosynthesis protein [Sphingomonas sp. AR_OL41]MDH7972791.1 PhzF family phenazine biosynthesis protein [Sphingomonas sp. AR_OL41]
MRIPFAQIDAFAAAPFTGNPAAVMPLAAWLPDDVLQKIAAENNVSETAFLVPIAASDDDGGEGPDFELRWFTPTSEVVLCGHATLASGHFVLSSDPARDSVRFLTRKAGILSVARAGDDYELALPAWAPSPKQLPEIVAGLGLSSAVETLWHPHRYALVVLEDAAAIRALAPDFRKLAAQGDVLTIVTAPGEGTDVISRAFAPGAGIDEDPVTGSAHAVMVPYWAKRLGRDRFTAYQASERGGYLTCRLDGDRVVLGGRCVTVIEGTFFL